MYKSLYDVLGIDKNASFEEIKSAYKNKVKNCHPDLNNNDGLSFRLLKIAYDILSDEDKRAEYDSTGFCGIKEFDQQKLAYNFLKNEMENQLDKIEKDETYNFLADIEKNIQQKILICNERIRNSKKKAEKLSKIKKKLSRKQNTDPILETILEDKIDSCNFITVQTRFEIEVLQMASKLLKNYKLVLI